MRVSAFFTPFFAILASVLGYYLRVSELANVFDPETGLAMRNAETTFWLITLSVVFVASIIIFAAITASRHQALPGFEDAFGTDPLSYPIVFVLIGISWIVGTYMHYLALSSSVTLNMIDIVFLSFSAISAISVTFFAIEMYQDSRRKAPYALSVIPTVFLCFWLILIYRQNASNPVLLSYVYMCFALLANALSFYFTSGFLYGKPSPGKSIAAYYSAIYFCAVTLADDHSLGIKVILCAMIAANLIHSVMLIRNLQKKYG